MTDGLAAYVTGNNTTTSFYDKNTFDNPHKNRTKKKSKRCKPGKKVVKLDKPGI